MSRRYDRDLCQSCAYWPYDCPWIKEATEGRLEMMQLLSNPVPCCTEYEEERR